jgi:hypothetical protein
VDEPIGVGAGELLFLEIEPEFPGLLMWRTIFAQRFEPIEPSFKRLMR